jgi:hypothetical protein
VRWKRIAELGGGGLALFLAGAVLGGVVIFGLHQQHWLPGGGTRQVEAFSEVDEALAGELAERFRPWLEFDSDELWRPLRVSALLDEGDHRFCTRSAEGPDCAPIQSAEEFDSLARAAGALGPATYIDIEGGTVKEYHGPEECPPLEDCGKGPRSAIYYHVTESNNRFYVDFWWFLRFNHFPRSHPGLSCHSQAAIENDICDEHEGDWEGVTVVTPPDESEKVDYVVYAAHKGTFRYTASQLQMHDGTRPTVYVAQGSHASYPAPCAHDCSQPPGLAVDGLIDLPESNFDGKVGWARNGEPCPANAPGSCLESLTGQAWTTWPGQWGAGCGDACGKNESANSPHSPGLQSRYQTPWCSSQAGVFTCDGRALRCSDWLGPLVVAVACDPPALESGLRANDEVETGKLVLIINGGEERSQATTPGVVQALGSPLHPGDTLTVIPDGPATQVLVRAEQAGVTVESRFAGLAKEAGEKIVVNVTSGSEGPIVLANGRRPVERRVLEEASGL